MLIRKGLLGVFSGDLAVPICVTKAMSQPSKI